MTDRATLAERLKVYAETPNTRRSEDAGDDLMREAAAALSAPVEGKVEKCIATLTDFRTLHSEQVIQAARNAADLLTRQSAQIKQIEAETIERCARIAAARAMHEPWCGDAHRDAACTCGGDYVAKAIRALTTTMESKR